MSEIEARLKNNHPAVYLTLVSVVVALALEDLLSQIRESTVLWQPDVAAVHLWLQVLLAFVAAFGLWVAYSALVLSLHWALGAWDAAQVFMLAIHLYLFNSVAFIDRGYLLLYAAASFMIFGNGVLFSNLRRARHYDENREILGRTSYRSTLWFGLALGSLALPPAIVLHARGAPVLIESFLYLAYSVGLLIWLWLFMRAWRRSVTTPKGAAA